MAEKTLPAFLKKKGAKDDGDGDESHPFVPRKKGGKGKVPPQFLKHQSKNDDDGGDKKKRSAAVRRRFQKKDD